MPVARLRAWQVAAALALALVAPGVARAGDDPETAAGRTYFSEGSALYARGEYAEAARQFARGYSLEPWSGFLFAWAQADRRAGSCATAIELYSRFIATGPSAEARALALEGIAVCGGSYVEPPQAPGGTAAPGAPSARPPADERGAAPAAPAASRPGFPHKLALTFGALGLASGAIAVRCYTWSTRDADLALTAVNYDETRRLYERSRDRLTVARVAGAVGLGLAVAGVVRFVVHRDDDHPLAVVLSPTGTLGVVGQF